ncbi:MAG: hypothetical protein OHK0046_24050 [Anaerolineae bacterium]
MALHDQLIAHIQQNAQPLTGPQDLDPLMERIGDARLVLLGEASHGTSEYYTWRAQITKRLIREKGFSFIGVEGDWPDSYTVNRYIKNYPDSGESAYELLHAYNRWPTWMWANWEVVALVEWLRRHNLTMPEKDRVGFYGLDVYSLWESLAEITRYLQTVDDDAVEAARQAYTCFQPYDRNAQAYAWASQFVPSSCESAVMNLLTATERLTRHMPEGDGESAFNAAQNARSVAGAEHYYRSMIPGGATSWNIRDHHMVDTLANLLEHHGPESKAIIWEHNTHIGDARATDMAVDGMVNVGQLVRERWGEDQCVLVGFSSNRGTVIAGNAWDGPMEEMRVPRARPDSWDGLFHEALDGKNALVIFQHTEDDAFQHIRPQRAIGVVYHPQYESRGNYIPTSLANRYDVLLYIDETRALHPLHVQEEAHMEPPETYPWAV